MLKHNVLGCLQQVPGLDLQVAVDQRGGHFFGEDVQREDALALEIGQDLVAPGPNFHLRSRCCAEAQPTAATCGRQRC